MHLYYFTFGEPPLWSESKDVTVSVKPPETISQECAVVLQVGAENDAEAGTLVEKWRRNANPACVVFVNGSPSPFVAALIDDVVDTPAMAVAAATRIADRAKQCVEGVWDLGADFRMAGYLFSHDAVLRPVRDPESHAYYRYPLAEVLGDSDVNVPGWVERMVEMGILEADELLDRLRLCPQCGSARLNYRDVCSSCGNLRIVKMSFLHCFTCGHVAPDGMFLSEGRLVCPNCQARLRLLGSDYDRTLDSLLCQSCGSRQSEAHVTAACISCGKNTEPEQLAVYEVYSYRLSARGENTALLGNTDYLLTSLDILNITRYDVFLGMVDWLLKLHRRYKDLCFGLIGIQLPNLTELVARVGPAQAAAIMDMFSSKMRELVRDTDLISRSDKQTLWVVLPKTPAEGTRMVLGRIRKIQDEMILADDSKVPFVSVDWSADRGAEMDSAEMLLASLASRMAGEAQNADSSNT